MKKFKFILKNKIEKLPKNNGVYCFKNRGAILYIGKAANIKQRVKNHFPPGTITSFSARTKQPTCRDNLFINQVKKIGYIQTNSEIEALILEANLIKKYQPRFNVLWRDDKNYFYVAITKEKYPRIFITHQPKKISNFQFFPPRAGSRHGGTISNYIGPFIEGTALKKTLRFLRKTFPYYTVRRHPKNPCNYCRLKLCPGPNPDFKNYKNNIKNLIAFFKGKKKSVLKNLRREMENASRVQDFEKAAKVRDKIFALEKVLAHTKVIIPSEISQDNWYITQRILQKIIKTKREINRIEAYDISNIQGVEATGSAVVFKKGKPEKSSYRRFKIINTGKPNDVGMIKEILERRFNHPEWPYPDLILIDGGRAQLNTTLEVLNRHKSVKSALISVLALAKKENKLYIEGQKSPISLKNLPREIFNLILQLRDEAHRFARVYHHKLREIDLRPKK